MRKFLIACLAIILLINNNYGQTKNDSIEVYKKVNKWAVVKLTIAYMEDLRNWSSEFDKKNVKPHLVNEFDDYVKLVKDYNEYSESIDLDKFSPLLKDNWKGTKDAVFEKYKIELFDSVTVNNFENIRFVPGKTANQNRSNAIKLINEKYNSLFPKQEKENEKVEELEVAKMSSNLDINANKNKDEYNLSTIIIYSLLAISVLLNVILFFRLKSQHKKKEEEKKNIYEDFYKSENASLKNENEKLKEGLSQLKKEKLNYTNSGSIVDKVTSPIEKPIEDEKPKVVEFSDVTPMKVDSNKMIYFPSPFEERRFTVEDAKEIEQPTSLYVANIDKKSNKGIITLIETADLSRALNSPNRFLETVCEYENVYNPLAKGIRVVKDGEVVLEAEDWVVTTKIRIKFI